MGGARSRERAVARGVSRARVNNLHCSSCRAILGIWIRTGPAAAGPLAV
jgi:hypothetical protein